MGRTMYQSQMNDPRPGDPNLLKTSMLVAAVRRHVAPRLSHKQFLSTEIDLKSKLRSLLRDTAQPVAVVTSTSSSGSAFHGATLSSFTSVAFDPYPIISFALRTPSRMADSLTKESPNMVVNLLSADQASVAVTFSRPDLHPQPFNDASLGYGLNKEGNPVLKGVLGALNCQLLSVLPLHDLEYLQGTKETVGEVHKDMGVVSRLFLARVMKVEQESDQHPLIYHRRAYTSVGK